MIQIYYFTPCCGNLSSFGVTSGTTSSWNDFEVTPGNVYGIVIPPSFSGCVTYSGSTLDEVLPNIPIINGTNPLFLPYDNCQFCITNIFPCYTPPTPSPPSIINGYKNECGIITILPMVVECVTSNPSSYESSDGEISVKITGGTPPYITTWTDGPISPAFGGLGIGSYTATTVDYWGDYTATTICTLTAEKNCEFSASIEEYFVEECFDNGMSGYTFDLT
jgi:hypothetical protein